MALPGGALAHHVEGPHLRPDGGIVAAASTSLPETFGGVRNWHDRYCWLRDATQTLGALMRCGCRDEAIAWWDWLLRAAAGDPADLQIMYRPGGERRLEEWEVPWLSGYESPPRCGLGTRPGPVPARRLRRGHVRPVRGLLSGGDRRRVGRALQLEPTKFLETAWTEPDEGIWEVRGPRRHFTHSKVMAWVAIDRAVRMVEDFGHEGPVDAWRALRDQIHEEVSAKGYNSDVGAFTQYYGSAELDASLLMIPLVGFLPVADDRVRSTIEAIERDLTEDGLVMRYRSEPPTS